MRSAWSAGNLLAVAGVIALLVVSAIVGSLAILGIGERASLETERQIRHAIAVDDASIHAKGIANDERGYLLSGNEQFLGEITARTELARLAFEEALRTADDEQRSGVVLARDGFEAWIDALTSTIATYQAGDVEGAVALSLGDTRQLRKAYEAALIQADAHAVDTMRTASDSTTTTSSWSVAVLIGYMLFVTAIGVGLAVAVLNHLSGGRPAEARQEGERPI